MKNKRNKKWTTLNKFKVVHIYLTDISQLLYKF